MRRNSTRAGRDCPEVGRSVPSRRSGWIGRPIELAPHEAGLWSSSSGKGDAEATAVGGDGTSAPICAGIAPSSTLEAIDPLPSLSAMLKWEGPLSFRGYSMKPSLSWDEQVGLMVGRGLAVSDEAACARFLAVTNYYRFSGYARYFQKAPHLGDDDFYPGTTFDEIRAVYDADEALRTALIQPLARVEVMLRSHVARVIADEHGPYGRYLEECFYTDIADREPTVEACLRDIERSKDRHILRYRDTGGDRADYSKLPVWSAVEAWSFGTLSKAIERGGQGSLADPVATSIGVAKAGFPYRVKALVYLRNRASASAPRRW